MGRVAASADVFRAVADPTRRALLDLLLASDRSVIEMTGRFRMTQLAISQHLQILRRAGLVRARQVGRRRLYRINPKPIQEVYDWAANYRQFVDPSGHVWAVASTMDRIRSAQETNQKVFRVKTLPGSGCAARRTRSGRCRTHAREERKER